MCTVCSFMLKSAGDPFLCEMIEDAPDDFGTSHLVMPSALAISDQAWSLRIAAPSSFALLD